MASSNLDDLMRSSQAGLVDGTFENLRNHGRVVPLAMLSGRRIGAARLP